MINALIRTDKPHGLGATTFLKDEAPSITLKRTEKITKQWLLTYITKHSQHRIPITVNHKWVISIEFKTSSIKVLIYQPKNI